MHCLSECILRSFLYARINGACECARILKPGGVFLACREHVADDAAQLRAFLDQHPIHQLTQGEHAYSLPVYLRAIAQAGLELAAVLGPWDSVVNAFPGVTAADELPRYPERVVARRLGRRWGWLGRLPVVKQLIWWRLKRPVPGRLYSFLARRP